jgi:hypothetical protein
MEENTQHQRALTFNDDGTIDPAQLEGMSQEFIDNVNSEGFIANARQQIKLAKQRESFRRGAQFIKAQARAEHEQRRPSGMSGRQRKRLRRAARKMAHATMQIEAGGMPHVAERELPDHQSRPIS